MEREGTAARCSGVRSVGMLRVSFESSASNCGSILGSAF